MDSNVFLLNEPVTFSTELEETMEYMTDQELIEESEDPAEIETSESTEVMLEDNNTQLPDDLLTNEIYMNGISQLVNTIDDESVHEEIQYVDRGTFYNLGSDLPDYAVVYECNGVEVIFPTDYAENIIISDGMLVNLGDSYTAGLQLDGYSVDNYLSSELTIPTYHSATWYQYLQSYGQPYRIVDRYVNNYGSISSSTRSSVSVEWSGGNPWEGFTFDRAAMFIIIAVLLVMLVFRKGKR